LLHLSIQWLSLLKCIAFDCGPVQKIS